MSRLLIAVSLMLNLLILQASAISYGNAFTNSSLLSYDSSFSASKIISKSQVVTPETISRSEGEVESDIHTSRPGELFLNQSLAFYASKEGTSWWYGTASSSVSGMNVTFTNTRIKGLGWNKEAFPLNTNNVEVLSIGMAIALPGAKRYDHSLTGGHNITTDCAGPSPYRQALDRAVNLSFYLYPQSFDVPADIFSQEVSLDYGIYDNQLSFYSYDFSKTVQLNNIVFESAMELTRGTPS